MPAPPPHPRPDPATPRPSPAMSSYSAAGLGSSQWRSPPAHETPLLEVSQRFIRPARERRLRSAHRRPVRHGQSSSRNETLADHCPSFPVVYSSLPALHHTLFNLARSARHPSKISLQHAVSLDSTISSPTCPTRATLDSTRTIVTRLDLHRPSLCLRSSRPTCRRPG